MKKFLKKLLIPALESKSVSGLGAFLFGSGIPVFMLHRMQTGDHPYKGTSPDHLRRCLQYLTDKGYLFISIEDILHSLQNQVALPKKSVAFTMDDGYWDQAEIAASIFHEFNCPATLFVITGMLDGLLWPWDAKVAHLIGATTKREFSLPIGHTVQTFRTSSIREKHITRENIRNHIKSLDANDIDKLVFQLARATDLEISDIPPYDFRPMTWDMARGLEQIGVRIGPHSVSHRMLSKLDDHSAEHEIIDSWKRLTDELKSPSPVFCYPTGRSCDYGVREISLLIKQNFIGAFSSSPGHIMQGKHLVNYNYNLPRFTLPTDFHDFIQYCSWIEHMKNKLRLFHD